MKQASPQKAAGPSEAYREVALVQNEAARRAHQELFSFDDSRYVMCGGNIIESVSSLAAQGVDKMHVATDWEHLLRIALWSSSVPPLYEVLNLLKRLGVSDPELAPFRSSGINDLFPWLYYGKKFDTLRRLCNVAKAKAETGVETARPHVICHLVADDAMRIVASSL